MKAITLYKAPNSAYACSRYQVTSLTLEQTLHRLWKLTCCIEWSIFINRQLSRAECNASSCLMVLRCVSELRVPIANREWAWRGRTRRMSLLVAEKLVSFWAQDAAVVLKHNSLKSTIKRDARRKCESHHKEPIAQKISGVQS